jgi:hypothetical protein
VHDLELLDDGEVVLHAMGGKTVTLEWPEDTCGVDLDREEAARLRDWLTEWLNAPP